MEKSGQVGKADGARNSNPDFFFCIGKIFS
jgi:hypothetical protein